MDPDDPRWLSREPDLATVDLQVLRQAGVPEPVLFLAVRDARSRSIPAYRFGDVGACRSYTDLSYLDECDEDPFRCYDNDH